MKFVIATVLVFFSLFANASPTQTDSFHVSQYDTPQTENIIVAVLARTMVTRGYEQTVTKTGDTALFTYENKNSQSGVIIKVTKSPGYMSQFGIAGVGTEGVIIQQLMMKHIRASIPSYRLYYSRQDN